MTLMGEDEEEVYFLIATPQLFLDTPDTAPSAREGGAASQIIETVSSSTFRSNFFPRIA